MLLEILDAMLVFDMDSFDAMQVSRAIIVMFGLVRLITGKLFS